MTTETAFGILAVILVLFLAAATAKAASDKGCSATLWFIAGVLLPGVALVVALFLDKQLVKECPRCVGSAATLASVAIAGTTSPLVATSAWVISVTSSSAC
jgi:hypothetical protein